jgi:catechol 2,3-dioxygenase-like lactoylglutathione lyase family enzyme
MSPEPSPIESISAVTLVTADMAAAVGFYETVGFNLVRGGPDAPFTSFAAGSGFVNLQAGGSTQHEVWGRVIFWVTDVDAIHDRTVRAGLRPTTAPRDAEWGERYFHILDPDGHELSFARPLRS